MVDPQICDDTVRFHKNAEIRGNFAIITCTPPLNTICFQSELHDHETVNWRRYRYLDIYIHIDI